MSVVNFIRLILQNWKKLFFIPLLSSIMIFILISLSPKEYRSSMRMYTGFGSGDDLASSSGTQKFDFYAVNNAFDNLINTIKSDVVLQNLGLTLFSYDIINGGDGNEFRITQEHHENLLQSIPTEILALIDTSSVQNSVVTLNDYMQQSTSNFLYELIHLKHPHYSIHALKEIRVKKIGSSDFIELSYKNDNAVECYQTLAFLSANFIDIYRNLRSGKTEDMVQYFRTQLAVFSKSLTESEDIFMEFSKKNKIINYYEQTKAIAGQLQSFEMEQLKMLTINSKAKKTVEHLEQEIGLNSNLYNTSNMLLDKRDEISSRITDAVTSNLFVNDSSYLEFNVHAFDDTIIKEQSALNSIMDTILVNKQTPQGIEMKNILRLWLENVITYEATNAALEIIDNRRKELEKMFDFYAPVGATVKRMEREINIREQEYLSLLESLTISELRQQDIMMSSASLRVVDDPVFPIFTEPSKKAVLSILTFMATFISILGAILMLELTDKTLRDAQRTNRVSGYEVLGIVPLFKLKKKHQYKSQQQYKKNLTAIHKISSDQMISQIFKIRDNIPLPLHINVLSMENQEGKTYICDILQKEFTNHGYSVEFLNYQTDFDINSKQYSEAAEPSSLVRSKTKSKTTMASSSFDISLVELPSLTSNVIPNNLIRNATLNLLVCRANRAWHDVDAHICKLITPISKTPLYIVLNGADESDMDNFIGEIPKDRSRFRRFIKRIAAREYSSANKLK